MRLKVLHVVPGLDPAAGGPSRCVLGLARAQAANGASVSLATGGTATLSVGEVSGPGAGAGGSSNGLLIRQGPILLQRFAIPAPRLMSILHRSIRTADIVHLHSLWNGVITGAGCFARRHCKPVVLSPHGMLDAHNIKRRGSFKRWYLRLVDGRNLEALAAGAPVIASDRVTAAVELIEDGVNGFLHGLGDIATLADKMRAVLTLNHTERALMSAAARATVIKFGHEFAANNLVEGALAAIQ